MIPALLDDKDTGEGRGPDGNPMFETILSLHSVPARRAQKEEKKGTKEGTNHGMAWHGMA